MKSKREFSLILLTLCLELVHLKRFRHYLLDHYRKEIRILENGTYPKKDNAKLQAYKKEIEQDEEMFRFKAWYAMNEDSRLYDEIPRKNYSRFKFRKKRKKKAMKSSEKWYKRVRRHFLQNFLVDHGYYLRRRNFNTKRSTLESTTLLLLPYKSDNFLSRVMQKILPSFIFYKYNLPVYNIFKTMSSKIKNLVKTGVHMIRGNTRRNKTRTLSNKTQQKFVRKVEKCLRRLEIDLGMPHNHTTKKLTKSQKKYKELTRRVRRKKKLKRLLKKVNKLYPTPATFFTNWLGMRELPTTAVTWKTKRPKYRTTRRRHTKTRKSSTVMSKSKRKKAEKMRKREERARFAKL